MSAHVIASQYAPDTAIFRDFTILCLWSVFGQTLSVLFCITGYGVEITQALGAAG